MLDLVHKNVFFFFYLPLFCLKVFILTAVSLICIFFVGDVYFFLNNTVGLPYI